MLSHHPTSSHKWYQEHSDYVNNKIFQLKQTYLQYCLQYDRCTVQRSHGAPAFCSSKRTLFTGQSVERNYCYGWSFQVIVVSREQKMELLRLWWAVLLSRCSYLFQLFLWIVCFCNFLLILEKTTFMLLFFDEVEEKGNLKFWDVAEVQRTVTHSCTPSIACHLQTFSETCVSKSKFSAI